MPFKLFFISVFLLNTVRLLRICLNKLNLHDSRLLIFKQSWKCANAATVKSISFLRPLLTCSMSPTRKLCRHQAFRGQRRHRRSDSGAHPQISVSGKATYRQETTELGEVTLIP